MPEITTIASSICKPQYSFALKLLEPTIKRKTPNALKPIQRFMPIPGESHLNIRGNLMLNFFLIFLAYYLQNSLGIGAGAQAIAEIFVFKQARNTG